MKRFVISTVLSCVVFGSALAGEIPSGGAPQPPPNGTSTAPGDISTPGVAQGESEATVGDAISGLLRVLGMVL